MVGFDAEATKVDVEDGEKDDDDDDDVGEEIGRELGNDNEGPLLTSKDSVRPREAMLFLRDSVRPKGLKIGGKLLAL